MLLIYCLAALAQAQDVVESRLILSADNSVLSHPSALVIGVGGLIYVADTGNNRLVALDATGKVQIESSKGGSAGELLWPVDVAVGPGGQVYVADKGKRKIYEFSRLLEWKGELVISDDDGNALAPNLIATNRTGDLVVCESDNGQIIRYDGFFQIIARLGGQSGQNISLPSSIVFSNVYGLLWIEKQENIIFRSDPLLSNPAEFRDVGLLPLVHEIAAADSALFFIGEYKIFRFDSSVLDSVSFDSAGLAGSRPGELRIDALSRDSLVVLNTRDALLLGLHWP